MIEISLWDLHGSALVASIEATEDDPVAGAAELQRVTESFERVLFIGITCGLSAPFVGGQLEYCLDHPEKFTPVLMGYNPVSMARKIQVPKWSNQRTFFDIATRMEATAGAIILNPIVGPEPISGSSRMKSGTATKVMLDAVFLLAAVGHGTNARALIEEFRDSVNRMDSIKKDLADVVQQAGNRYDRSSEDQSVSPCISQFTEQHVYSLLRSSHFWSVGHDRCIRMRSNVQFW